MSAPENQKMNKKDNKSIIIGISGIIIVTLIIILFNIKNGNNSLNNNDLSYEQEERFNDNIYLMKEAVNTHLENGNYPTDLNESIKITLKQLYEEKLLLKLTDGNNKICSQNDSYSTVTKLENKYQVIIKLSCPSKEDELIYYIDIENPSDDNRLVDNENIQYQYKLVKGGYYTDWSSWSSWTTNKYQNSSVMLVETKTTDEPYTVTDNKESFQTITASVTCKKGYKLDQNKCIKITTQTTNKVCPNGYKMVNSICQKETITVSLSSANNIRISRTTKRNTKPISNTAINNVPTSVSASFFTTNSICPEGYTMDFNRCIKERVEYSKLVYVCPDGYEKNSNKCVKKITNTTTSIAYKKVTYFRFKTREYINAKTDIKWSTSNYDTNLLNKGYILTGKTQNN